MHFHIVTIFPEIISAYMDASIMGRAQKEGHISVTTHNPREHATDKHKTVDDKAYGGGPGMVMKAEPIIKSVDEISGKKKVILFSPHGTQFSNDYADELTEEDNIVLISGRYEGIDARVQKALGAEMVSIGPYTLTGGELPALVVMDAVTRRLPGVLGSDESVEERRTAGEGVYTRPETFTYEGKEYNVPDVLLSGDHKKIEEWRKEN